MIQKSKAFWAKMSKRVEHVALFVVFDVNHEIPRNNLNLQGLYTTITSVNQEDICIK